MSELHLAQIRRHLNERYKPFLDLGGADHQHHVLSRALAGLVVAVRTGLPEKTAAGSVTDDALDAGVDAVAYAADRSTLVIAQTKWTDTSAGITQGDILKFVHGVEQLVSNRWDQIGGPLLARRSEIEDILFQPGTRIELVVATSSAASLGMPQEAALADFCNRMNDATDIASYVYLNQPRIYASVASSGYAQIDLNVNLRNWGAYQEAGCAAYYGTATVQEVVDWYKTHGDLLFSRNIRGALVGTDVNDAIIATAAQDPDRFWFFNNGITIIAETFEQAPYVNQKSGTFTFRQASVVNGAQTVSSLARAAAHDPKLLESADVFVRFVTIEDPGGEFARLVTRRTNTQNRIGGREFVALDPEQERLRMEFAVSGLRYAYRSGESVADPSKGCDLSDATVALACRSSIADTVLAKREISRLWEDTSKPPYRALFNPSVTGSDVWTAVEVMRWVDAALVALRAAYDGRDRLILVHGNRVILWAVMEHAGLRSLTSEEAFQPPLGEGHVTQLAREAARQLVSLVNADYPDSYPQPLFKNLAKCRALGEALLKGLKPHAGAG